MAGYTTGPWVFDGTLDRNDQPIVAAEHNVLIATICHECVKPVDELNANAHLIAAATDMYEALREMERTYNELNEATQESEAACLMARAALTKAEGNK